MGGCASKPNNDQQTNDQQNNEQRLFDAGYRYLIHGKYDDALKHFDEAIAINEDFERAHLYRAAALSRLDKLDLAEAECKFTLSMNPNNLKAQSILGGISERRGDKTKTDEIDKKILASEAITADDHMAQAMLYALSNNLEESSRAYYKALETAPNPFCFFMISGNFARLGKHQESKEAALKALELDDEYSDAWYQLGLAHEVLGEHQEAKAAFVKVTQFKPEYSDAWYGLANAHAALKESLKAIELFNKALELSANDADVYAHAYGSLGITKCEIAEETGNKALYSEAINDIETAISLKPGALKYCNLGKVLVLRDDAGDAQKAAEAFAKAYDLYQDTRNHEGLIPGNKAYIEGIFSNERMQLLEKLAKLASTNVEIIAPGESTSDDGEVEQLNIDIAKATKEKKELIGKASNAFDPKSRTSVADMGSLADQMQAVFERLARLEAENTALKQKLTHMETTTVKKSEVSYAMSKNYEWVTREERIKAIKVDLESSDYYEIMRFDLTCTYDALKLALDNTLSINTSNIAVTGIAYAVSFVPFAGTALSQAANTAGDMFQTSMIKHKAVRITDIAPDSIECAKFAEELAAKVASHPKKASEIHSADAPRAAESSWGQFVAKLKSVHADVNKVLNADKYKTTAAKLAHRDTDLLIEKLGNGEIAIEPKDSLVDRCCIALGLMPVGEVGEEGGFGFE